MVSWVSFMIWSPSLPVPLTCGSVCLGDRRLRPVAALPATAIATGAGRGGSVLKGSPQGCLRQQMRSTLDAECGSLKQAIAR